MAIDLEKKSNRLLGSRRFTSADLTAAQEAFAAVLDIQASEVYTKANLIPSSGLPFSGSTQSGQTYTSGSDNVMKYYFRQRLTKSNVGNDVHFFIVPTGSNSGVTPQLIQDGQQGNFISPKYSTTALANANAEDGTPGYNVRVFVSTSTDSGSLGGGDVVSSNSYQFDYKTGVLQFDSNVPGSSDIVYMTAYQYVGETLDQVDLGGGGITISNNVDNRVLTGDGSNANAEANLTFDGSTLTLSDITFNVSSSQHLSITGSKFDFKATGSSDLFSVLNNSDENIFKVEDGYIVLGEKSSTPTAVAGGVMYSGSNFYLGID